MIVKDNTFVPDIYKHVCMDRHLYMLLNISRYTYYQAPICYKTFLTHADIYKHACYWTFQGIHITRHLYVTEHFKVHILPAAGTYMHVTEHF